MLIGAKLIAASIGRGRLRRKAWPGGSVGRCVGWLNRKAHKARAVRDEQIPVARIVRMYGTGEKREQQRSTENATQHIISD